MKTLYILLILLFCQCGIAGSYNVKYFNDKISAYDFGNRLKTIGIKYEIIRHDSVYIYEVKYKSEEMGR